MTPVQQAALLGVLQGLTEFLPVSSSAHLRLVPELAGWPYLGKGFDVALHGGTLFALMAYFRADLLRLVRAVTPGREPDPEGRRLLGQLAAASLPVATVGFLLEKFLEGHFQDLRSMAFWLAAVGLAMGLADRIPGQRTRLELRQAMLVGLAQVLALFPGASRSGTTMAASRGLGLEREAAARFSFLLGLPVILGATVYKLLRLDGIDLPVLLAGMSCAALSGWLALHVFFRWLPRIGLGPFTVYRLALAALLLLLSGGAQARTLELEVTPPGPEESLYRYVPFEVPRGTGRVRVSYAYDHQANTVDIGLFDSAGFRGWSGGRRDAFFVSPDEATPGYLAGRMPPGTWSVILGLYKIAPEGTTVRLEIELEPGSSESKAGPPAPELAPRGETGWYSGDLHMHSEHSDGRQTLAQLVGFAGEQGLQFLGLTDHNTVSHHGAIQSDRVLLLWGEEVTTRHGHCNVWGCPPGHWLDFRKPVRELVSEVHGLGGLLSINHPFADCQGCSWEYGFDLGADAVEVWNGAWDASDEKALESWVGLLSQGRRLPMVGSSDSHKLTEPIGRPTLHVWSSELAPGPLLTAVARGRSYVTADPATPPLFLQAGEQGLGATVFLERPGPVKVLLKGPGHLTLVTSRERRAVTPGETTLEVTSPDFVLLEARNEAGGMLGLTNPIYFRQAVSALRAPGL